MSTDLHKWIIFFYLYHAGKCRTIQESVQLTPSLTDVTLITIRRCRNVNDDEM